MSRQLLGFNDMYTQHTVSHTHTYTTKIENSSRHSMARFLEMFGKRIIQNKNKIIFGLEMFFFFSWF